MDLEARVTSITPRSPSWWERIIRFLTGGSTVPNPTGLTASFDQPSYAPGTAMKLSVTATAGTSPQDVTATITFYRKADLTTPVGTTEAATTVDEPDQLSSSVTDSGGREYTAGPVSQAGASYSAEFTATA